MAVMQSPENWQRFRRAALPGIRAADANAMERLAQRYTLPSAPEDRMLRFTRPSVIITGRQDHIVGYEDQDALLSRYPRASFLVLDEAGHNVHLDQPDLVRAALRAWSASLVDGR
jgi:pimeloyl-ACP methyl ester carboxylesterase